MFQEYIYACATPDLVGTATGWAADRLAEEIPGFAKDANPLDESEPFYLTGEHFMRRVYDEDPGLAPLKGRRGDPRIDDGGGPRLPAGCAG